MLLGPIIACGMTHRVINHQPSHMLVPRPTRPKTAPSLSYRAAVTVLTALTFLLPFVLSYLAVADLDVCVVDRFPTKPTPLASAVSYLTSDNSTTPGENITSIQEPPPNSTLADLLNGTSSESLLSTLAIATDAVATSATDNYAPLQPATIMIACLLVCCLIKSLVPPSPHLSQLRWLGLVKVLLAYMWYMAAYFLCNALKGYIGDERCNNHHNSISGHYLFHLYAGLALLHIHAQQTHATHHSLLSRRFYQLLFSKNESKLFMFVWICYAMLSAIILMDTYLLGYHSLRQILYGVSLAMVCHWMMMEVLDMMDDLLYDMALHHFEQHNDGGHGRRLSSSSSHTSPLSHSGLMRKRTLHTPVLSSSPAPSTGRALATSALSPTNSANPPASPFPFTMPPAALPEDGSLTASASSTSPSAPVPRYVQSFTPFQRFVWLLVRWSVGLSERYGIFYVYPLLLVVGVQVLSFVLLLQSPASKLWRLMDVLAVVAVWVVVGYLYAFHLHLPLAKRDHSQAQHAQVA